MALKKGGVQLARLPGEPPDDPNPMCLQTQEIPREIGRRTTQLSSVNHQVTEEHQVVALSHYYAGGCFVT